MTLDHVLVRADFLGVVEAVGMGAAGDLHEVRLRVIDTWATRWVGPGDLTVRMAPDFAAARHLRLQDRAVVFLSGGAWRQSPFTHRDNSVFPVRSDGSVSCTSGNPLFAVTDAGFHCSIPALTAGAPMPLAAMRGQVLTLLARARSRQADLDRALASPGRPLEVRPRAPTAGAPEAEVWR